MLFNLPLVAVALTLSQQVSAAACPFESLYESGKLSKKEAEAFRAVKENPAAAEDLLKRHHPSPAKREPSPQSSGIVEGVLTGLLGSDGLLDLPLGGGLLNGILQPLSGVLQDLDIPTPQAQGLQAIPGDDPNHQFQAPGPTDRRGICPTLNTLANHGYISRDGITSFAESANAVQTGYGFGYGVSVALAAFGLLAGGDLITGKYSIGGADDRVPNTLGPALGLDKHGVFEIDGSITRQDVYFGNQADFLFDRWDAWVNQSNEYGNGQFGRDTMLANKGLAYDLSRNTNPEFYAGNKWLIVAHAERAFVYRGLANGTNQDVADYANVAPFYLNETFPENWYRRGEPYDLVNMATDILDLFLNNPRELGSADGLNNFTPLSPSVSLATPDDVLCFILQNVLDVGPDQVSPLIIDAADVVQGFIKGVLGPFFVDYNCSSALATFGAPSPNAGTNGTGSESAVGSPVDGYYSGNLATDYQGVEGY